MNHELDDEPVVYLIVRQSPDCSPKMVEIMGACRTLASADEMREALFAKTGIRTHVEWVHFTDEED